MTSEVMTTESNHRPGITILTVVYNGRPYIERTHYCIQRQTYRDWEWVVVDDGSRDGTWETLMVLADRDSRIRLLRHEKNQGRAKARHTALTAARGEWTAVWDMDDFYFPERLASIDEARQRGFDHWSSRAVLVDLQLRVKGIQAYDRPFPPMERRAGLHGAMAFRTDLGKQIGYSPELETWGGMGEDSKMLYTMVLQHKGMLEERVLMVNMVGAEVVLHKSMAARRERLQFLRGMHKAGNIPISAEDFGRIDKRERRRLAILSMLKAAPWVYPIVMKRRMRGEREAEQQLSAEQTAFLEDVRRQFPPTGEKTCTQAKRKGLVLKPRKKRLAKSKEAAMVGSEAAGA